MEILLYGVVGDPGEGLDAAWIVSRIATASDDIRVRINSLGGLLFDGFAIYNALKQSPQQVTVMIGAAAVKCSWCRRPAAPSASHSARTDCIIAGGPQRKVSAAAKSGAPFLAANAPLAEARVRWSQAFDASTRVAALEDALAHARDVPGQDEAFRRLKAERDALRRAIKAGTIWEDSAGT